MRCKCTKSIKGRKISLIEFVGISKYFQRDGQVIPAVQNVNLKIREGEFIAVVGPSGCGKSTLLNMISGLMKPTKGYMTYRGKKVVNVNPNVGYMTQKDNLLPWRDVRANIRIALEMRNVSKKERDKLVDEYIELVGLKGFEKHYPNEISGGMRKRVSLARTLVYNPETILMDEPFGALDAQLRLILQGELLRIWDEKKKTVIFVTHDLEEAVTLADRVVVFTSRPGTIREIRNIPLTRPRDVFKIPFTEEFGEIHSELWGLLSQDVMKGGEVG